MEITKEQVQQKATERERCRKDPFYLAEVLGYDFQADVHAELFANLLQNDGLKPENSSKTQLFDLSPTKNRLILWPRGHFKTSAIVLHIIQLILNYPDIRILLMQANLKLTAGWLMEIKGHFTGKNEKSRLPELFPEFCEEKLGSSMRFTTPARSRNLKEATVTAASPRAVATGQHYDIFFADDLVHTGNFRNIELLDKLESEFSHFVPLIDPGGYVTCTGTRYHHADIYGRIVERNHGDWMVSIKPSYDADGHLLFPQLTLPSGRRIGFTREFLDDVERNDPEMFSAQYMNRIVSAGSQIFTESLILRSVKSSKDKDFPTGAPCYFSIDLASGRTAASDHSTIAVGLRDGRGRIWIIECIGSTWSPSQLATNVLNMAVKLRPVCVFIEKSPGAVFFEEYLNTLAREHNIALRTHAVKIATNKDAKYLRIAALESSMRNGNLILAAGITDFERVKTEFVEFPKGRHDDRPDAIALLMNYMATNAGFVPAVQIAPWPMPVSPFEETRPSDDITLGFGFVN